jgi:hypothetical protein
MDEADGGRLLLKLLTRRAISGEGELGGANEVYEKNLIAVDYGVKSTLTQSFFRI